MKYKKRIIVLFILLLLATMAVVSLTHFNSYYQFHDNDAIDQVENDTLKQYILKFDSLTKASDLVWKDSNWNITKMHMGLGLDVRNMYVRHGNLGPYYINRRICSADEMSSVFLKTYSYYKKYGVVNGFQFEASSVQKWNDRYVPCNQPNPRCGRQFQVVKQWDKVGGIMDSLYAICEDSSFQSMHWKYINGKSWTNVSKTTWESVIGVKRSTKQISSESLKEILKGLLEK